jgi:hypothetical protein
VVVRSTTPIGSVGTIAAAISPRHQTRSRASGTAPIRTRTARNARGTASEVLPRMRMATFIGQPLFDTA